MDAKYLDRAKVMADLGRAKGLPAGLVEALRSLLGAPTVDAETEERRRRWREDTRRRRREGRLPSSGSAKARSAARRPARPAR